MVKEPRPGRVKTRLGRDIGLTTAAWWFRHQTRRLIRRLTDPRWDLILAVENGTPVGTARVLEKGSTGKIGRLAVLKPHRSKGIGAAIIRAALNDLATRPHIKEARLGAQIEAIPFYEALGFAPEGDEFLDAGLPHQEMVLRL